MKFSVGSRPILDKASRTPNRVQRAAVILLIVGIILNIIAWSSFLLQGMNDGLEKRQKIEKKKNDGQPVYEKKMEEARGITV
jgi:hypothetical protein